MIQKLEMLIALSKEEHFGRAAERVGVTQPTLSAGIRQLESQLGVKLVQRGSRYGGLTPEGQRALVWARQIVGDTRRLRDEMRASRRGLAGHLRIGVIPTALTWASRLCTAFAAQHPNVHFSILSRSSAEILRLMEGIEIDAGISYLDNEPLGRVSTARLYRERYAMVCAQNHPLADRPQIPWAEVAAQDLCLLTPDMQNRRIINRAFMEAGTSPTPRLEANSTVVLMAQVAEAGRVTVLPADLARFLGAGLPLCSIPIVRADTAETAGSQVEDGPMVGLITPHQEPHTPVLQALLRVARTVALPDD